jgi:hypothetical protein
VLRPLALALVMAVGAAVTVSDDQDGARSQLATEAAVVAPARLTPLPPEPELSGAHAFTDRRLHSAGRPALFDPCRPVTYAVRRDGELPGGDALIEDAVAQVAEATGLTFVRAGDATGPLPGLSALGRRGPDGAFPPVLVAWSTPREKGLLSGPTLAVGGATVWAPAGRTGEERLVSGLVALDAPELAELLAGPDGAARVRGVLLHELAHLVGLDHVEDRAQLMHPETTGRAFAAGDLQGLRTAGTGQCFLDW